MPNPNETIRPSRLLPGDIVITESEVIDLGLDESPPNYRSDAELVLAARRGRENYHG
jgi:hypothetical protein